MELRKIARVLFLLPLSAIALPLVAARGMTGISPLNKMVEMMAWMFNVPILKNPIVQQGFIRFMLFILFLGVAHFSFKKIFKDNKTAGIIATVFALISSFLMPSNWVTTNGGVITAVFTGLIPLSVIGIAIWFCVMKLDKNFATRLLAIVILFMCLAIINVYYSALNLPLILVGSQHWLKRWFRG